MYNYKETLNVQGIQIPFIPKVITPRIERQMRIGNYEGGECKAAASYVRKGDRVLELGGGIGLISCVAGKISGVERIVSIEANPELLEIIRETQRINGVKNAELRHGVVTTEDSEGVTFYLRGDFWGSSMEPDSRPYTQAVNVPGFSLDSLIKEISPHVIICDIEGGEEGLFEHNALTGVRTIIIEMHVQVYGRDGIDKILKTLTDRGFVVDQNYLAGSVFVLHRPEIDTARAKRLTPATHNVIDPKVTIVTCMKDEGPFILEWLAYHRSIGVTNFVIFTNDCSDGTDQMLDRLDEIGLVTHLPNPATVAKSTYFQPFALSYAEGLPVVKRADYVVIIDVDEFITIRSGKGRFTDLLNSAGPFHALSMSELNFNSSGIWTYEDCWITESFRDHETPWPGHWQARRGVKTIIHRLENIKATQAHRPFLYPGTEDDFVWLDGSGRLLGKDFSYSNPQNGIDRRGAYDLVCLNHYPLRSVESYLLKQKRGDVVKKESTYNEHYFRIRSLGGQQLGWIDPNLSAAREEWNRIMADETLAKMHAQAVEWHKIRIQEIKDDPGIKSLSDWIAEKYYPNRISTLGEAKS